MCFFKFNFKFIYQMKSRCLLPKSMLQFVMKTAYFECLLFKSFYNLFFFFSSPFIQLDPSMRQDSTFKRFHHRSIDLTVFHCQFIQQHAFSCLCRLVVLSVYVIKGPMSDYFPSRKSDFPCRKDLRHIIDIRDFGLHRGCFGVRKCLIT